MRLRQAAAALAVALVIAGCGSNESQPRAEPSPSTPQDSWQAVPTSSYATHQHTELTVVSVRVGFHETYDRVVLDLAGGNASDLTWKAAYTEEAITAGRGAPIDLLAPTYLHLTLAGQAIPSDTSRVVAGIIDESSVGNVTGVYVDPPFEGQSEIYIGVDRERGYRIITLESPARLVIDVQR